MSSPSPLQAILRSSLAGASRIAVLGIGAELRGDDAAGSLIAQRLKARLSAEEMQRVLPVFGGAAPENVTGEICEFEPSHVLMIDAAALGLAPGEGRLIGPEEISGVSFSTHMLPISILIAFLQERLPSARILALGLEPRGTELLAPPSKEILAAVDAIVGEIRAKAAELCRATGRA
jgi:hydrogenase 3 maturation protease